MIKINFKKITIILLVTILIVLGIFIIWANNIYIPDQNTLNLVLNNKNISVINKGSYWQISPKNCDLSCNKGLIYYPGAKVDPKAYFYKLSDLTDDKNGGWNIFITKPTLNLAFFSINQASKVIRENPLITRWTLGGHSLGGAMSCEYIKNNSNKIKSLILVGSYCATDISGLDVTVITINGSLDGLLNTDKLIESRKNLPINAKDILVEGMNHAQAGNYGKQAGDRDATKPDEEAKMIMIDAINSLVSN